jgi:hypothetical protein
MRKQRLDAVVHVPELEQLECRILLSVGLLEQAVAAAPEGDQQLADTLETLPASVAGTFVASELLIKLAKPQAVAGIIPAGGITFSGASPAPSPAGSLEALLSAYAAAPPRQVFAPESAYLQAGTDRGLTLLNASTPKVPEGYEDLVLWYSLSLAPGVDAAEAAAAFAADPGVQYAEPNWQYKLADGTPPTYDLPSVATDPAIDWQWYLTKTGTQAGWNYLNANGVPPGGNHSVIVAVIDTGVDYTHPELAGSMWTNADEIPGNGIDDDHNGFIDDIHGASVVYNPSSHSGQCMDLTGHGTHVAGIIAAQAYNHLGGVGVAFNVQIMSVRAGQYNGTFTVDDIAEGIIYAISNGADVINMSFGGYQRSMIVEDALAMALNQAVLVAAAGNDSRNAFVQPFYPAALPFVHGVQATNSLNGLTWFTNYNYDMSAPGEGIYSTLPGDKYAFWSGTSMAAPVVSGIAALVRSFYWDKQVYSSRFIMGALFASQQGGPVNAYRASHDQPPPGLILSQNWLFDDTTVDPGNDDDGRVDSGETINIAVELMNRSGFADNVVATLRARAAGAVLDDPYVTMVTSTIDYGSIGPFNTVDNGLIYDSQGVVTGVQEPFVFTVDPNCPNDHVISFELTTTCRNGWDPEDTNVYTRISRFEYVVQRGRNVPTVIASGTTVTLTADDYWIVGGPVLIEPGATLNIGPGTQMQWGALSSDPYNPGPQAGYMIVRGTLTVQGTLDNPANLFPSYLVSGQTTRITVDGGGTANLSYVNVRNPQLAGIGIIDHADMTWDAYSSTVGAVVITNTAFHKFRGGGTLSAAYALDTCLFDAGWIAPSNMRIDNTVFLQDNENNKPISYTPTVTYNASLLGNIQVPVYRDGYTYGIQVLAAFTDVMVAEYAAQYFGGHLASIHSAEDQAFLQSYLTTAYSSPPTDANAIGLVYDDYAGQYRWSDGSPVDFQGWADQPTNVSPGVWRFVKLFGDGWRVYTGHNYYYKTIVCLPGTWTQAQWDAEFASGRVTQYVRDNHVYLHDNAFLSKYWDPTITRWMRIVAPGPSSAYVAMSDNFWGTTTQQLIDYAIVDYNDNFTTARIDYGTPPEHGATTTWPFVESLLINGLSANTVPTVGAGPATFTITFNRDMDTSIQPYVTFGPSAPCTDFSVKPVGDGWVDARTWEGSFYMTPVTGEGYQLMRISGAVAADDPWLVSGYDVGRYRFQVKTMGVAAMTLQAAGQEGAIQLNWQQNDYDLLAGYNLYRSSSLNGTYTKINSTIIPAGSESYMDTNVTPAVPKYYKFTVVTTGMTESNYSNVASAAAVDTIPPVISHTAITSAKSGFGLQIAATVTDNVAVLGATLSYRPVGSGGAYTTVPMVNVSGSTWTASVPGSSVQPPGIEYYLTATDGISQTYHGTPAAPHTVVVTNTPTLVSVAPNQGPIQGGTHVSLSGTMFSRSGVVSVLFGGVPATDVVVLGDNQITCTTPLHIPELVDVTVINPDATQCTALHAFRFVDQAVVVSLPEAAGDHGAIVEIPISVSNVTGLRAADIRITFTSGMLSAQSVRVGPLATGWALSANLATPGSVTLSMASGTAVNGSDVLAYITFQVNGAPTSQSPLTIASASLNDGAIICDLSPGQFTVNGLFSLGGGVTYYAGGGPVSGTDLSLVGVGEHLATSGANGQFSLTDIATGSYTLTPSKEGDIAEITAYDASLVLQKACGLISLSANQTIAADVNRNGSVNSMDASYILEASVGLRELPFPGAGRTWDFVPASRSYPLINGDLTGQNFTAILLGDVSGNWQPPQPLGLTWNAMAQTLNADCSLTIGQVEGQTGQTVVVPVEIERAGNDVYAADIVVTYDASALEVENVSLGQAAAGMFSAVNFSQPGVIRMGLAGSQPMSADGPLAEIVFHVTGTLAEPAAIDLAAGRVNEDQVQTSLSGGVVHDTLGPVANLVELHTTPAGQWLEVRYSEGLSAGPAIILKDAATGLGVNQADMSVDYDPETRTAIWTFPGLPNARLPYGTLYTITVPAVQTADLAGNMLDGNADGLAGDDLSITRMAALAGDVTLDGSVDAVDFITLKRGLWRVSGAAWDSGDLNGDGHVDWSDLQTLMGNFGMSLGSAPVAAPTSPKPTGADSTSSNVTESTESLMATASATRADAVLEPELLSVSATVTPATDLLAIAASVLDNRLAEGHQGVALMAARPADSLPLSYVAVRVGPLPISALPLLKSGKAGLVFADVLQLAGPWWSGDSVRQVSPDEPWMTSLILDIAGKPHRDRLDPIRLDVLARR